MKKFSTWMIVLFVIMFWGFRVVLTLMAETGKDLGGITVLNKNFEIVLLFVVLLCVVLIVKRKMIGALIYLLAYGMYFGVDIINNIQSITGEGETGIYLNLMISIIGMILPILVIMDLLLDKNRKNHPKDKKTDWFYTNEQFDRKMDDRADKNNYRL